MTTTAETGSALRLHDPNVRGFASDNYSGVHPEVLAALAAANEGHQVSYGEDLYTARLQELMVEHFGPGIECFPVFNGTGANVLSLQSLLPRWGAVVCASTAHINMDENGAPERIGGMKLLQVPTPDGRLTPELIDREAWGWGDEHRAQPLAVSITKDAGVDILSFGGTKNGLLFGEVVVALNPEAAHGLVYLRKMNMQLASKMRFMSAQFIALLEGELWLRSASHANAMAARLRAGVEAIPGVELTQKTESNGVFAVLPAGVADRLRKSFRFYDWNEAAREVRWMCSFDTTEEDVDSFIAAIKHELADA